MFRDGLSRGFKMLLDGVWRHRLYGDQGDDRPSCRVGYGLENVSSHTLVAQFVKPIGCKYMRNRSVSQVLFLGF